MRKITINLPDSLEMNEQEVTLLLAAHLYKFSKLSLGQAADMVGYTKPAFAEILVRYNVSIFNYPASDLAEDIANA